MQPTLLQKIVATIQTRWNQARCKHGPWIRDWYLTDGKRTCHCLNCFKGATEGSFSYALSRDETRNEWLERATKGGLPLRQAEAVWTEFKTSLFKD